MSVTTIIVNFNSGDLLRDCLAHLERQTVRPNRIIVIDNASSDGSLAGASEFYNVTVCHMEENLGFARANNIAIRLVDTEFVALLNPDAFPEPDWLERLLGAAVENPNVAAFGSRQLCDNETQILDGIGDNYHISGLVWRERHGKRQRGADLLQKEIFSPCAAAVLYRREALIEIGGFDEDFFCYVEDVDVGFRLRLAGYRAIYVPNAVVRHIGSATTGGHRSNFSVYHGHRNLVWTYIKNMPSVLLWLSLPFHLALNVFTVALFSIRGQGRIILCAKRDALRGIRGAWCKRKWIQQNRVATTNEIWRALDKRLLPRRY